MSVINLTPHSVDVLEESFNEDEDRIAGADGLHWRVRRTYPASGEVLRLGTIDLGTQYYPDVDVPVELVEFGHLNNPPTKIPGTWYIVSLPCALAYAREDFLVPYIEVRDDQGQIVGCRFLGRPV